MADVECCAFVEIECVCDVGCELCVVECFSGLAEEFEHAECEVVVWAEWVDAEGDVSAEFDEVVVECGDAGVCEWCAGLVECVSYASDADVVFVFEEVFACGLDGVYRVVCVS